MVVGEIDIERDGNDEGAFGRTPDSLRVRRMRFEFDVEIEAGRRRRAASHSELMKGSPGKSGAISTREYHSLFSSRC